MNNAVYIVTISNDGPTSAFSKEDVKLALLNEAQATLTPEFMESLEISVD